MKDKNLILVFVILLSILLISAQTADKWKPDKDNEWPQPADLSKLNPALKQEFYRFLFEKSDLDRLGVYLTKISNLKSGNAITEEMFKTVETNSETKKIFYQRLEEIRTKFYVRDILVNMPVSGINEFLYSINKDSLSDIWNSPNAGIGNDKRMEIKILLALDLEENSDKKSEMFVRLWQGFDGSKKTSLNSIFTNPEFLDEKGIKVRNNFISSILTDEKRKKYNNPRLPAVSVNLGKASTELVKDGDNYFFKINNGAELRFNRWLTGIKVNNGDAELIYSPYGKDNPSKTVIIKNGNNGYIDETGYYKENGKSFGNHMFGEKTTTIGKNGKNILIKIDNGETVDLSKKINPKSWVLVDDTFYTVPSGQSKFSLEFTETGALISKDKIALGTAPKQYAKSFFDYLSEHDQYVKSTPSPNSEQIKQLETNFREQEKKNTYRSFFEIHEQKDSGFELFTDKNIPVDYLDESKKPKTDKAFFQIDAENNLFINKVSNVLALKSNEITSVKAYESENIVLAETNGALRIEINGENINIPLENSGSTSSSSDKLKTIRFESNNGLLINPLGSSDPEIKKIIDFTEKQPENPIADTQEIGEGEVINAQNQEKNKKEQERKRQEEIIAQENQARIDRQKLINQKRQQLSNSDLGRLTSINPELARKVLDANKKYTVVIFGEYCYYCTGVAGYSLDSMLRRELQAQGLSDDVDIQLAPTYFFGNPRGGGAGYNSYPMVQGMQSSLDNSGQTAKPTDMHQLVFKEGQLIYYNRGYGASQSWYLSTGIPPQIKENKARMIATAIKNSNR